MPIIKTATLVPPALDWAVAKIDQQQWDDYDCLLWVQDDEYQYNPSTDWSQGGPIIEREKIETYWHTALEMWAACHGGNLRYGPTPLIAAMRCFVASKLGDEIDVPEELL